ncbi:hypothetical protein HNR39_004459 [Glaciimonas immobilis]|uniref:Transposase n=1 Tax=Glaciimonas immobilis TaxID=728004 RepID=A0A840S1M2_9BURK|nr:hypothetical protein [Glaciimonas immobilis]
MADAEAICEAVSRPNMRFVPIKTDEQQAVLSLHRVRQSFIKVRTAKANQIRGLLSELGIIIPQAIANIARRLSDFILRFLKAGMPKAPSQFCHLSMQEILCMRFCLATCLHALRDLFQISDTHREMEPVQDGRCGERQLTMYALDAIATIRNHTNLWRRSSCTCLKQCGKSVCNRRNFATHTSENARLHP